MIQINFTTFQPFVSVFFHCHGTSQLLGLDDLEFCGQETNPDDSGRHANGSQGGQKPRSN